LSVEVVEAGFVSLEELELESLDELSDVELLL